jgi:hypothetical protein
MIGVARALAGKHLRDSQNNCGRHTRTPSPSSLTAKTGELAGQATGRQKRVVILHEWGTRQRATTLALLICGSLGWSPHLHAILKDGADDRLNDAQFRSDTVTRRLQYGPQRVESFQTLRICRGNVRVQAPGGGQPDALVSKLVHHCER